MASLQCWETVVSILYNTSHEIRPHLSKSPWSKDNFCFCQFRSKIFLTFSTEFFLKCFYRKFSRINTISTKLDVLLPLNTYEILNLGIWNTEILKPNYGTLKQHRHKLVPLVTRIQFSFTQFPSKFTKVFKNDVFPAAKPKCKNGSLVLSTCTKTAKTQMKSLYQPLYDRPFTIWVVTEVHGQIGNTLRQATPPPPQSGVSSRLWWNRVRIKMGKPFSKNREKHQSFVTRGLSIKIPAVRFNWQESRNDMRILIRSNKIYDWQ